MRNLVETHGQSQLTQSKQVHDKFDILLLFQRIVTFLDRAMLLSMYAHQKHQG